jgi:hypothetical protein
MRENYTTSIGRRVGGVPTILTELCLRQWVSWVQRQRREPLEKFAAQMRRFCWLHELESANILQK